MFSSSVHLWEPAPARFMNPTSPEKLIVAVCTYHRPHGLRLLLRALEAQRFEHNPAPDMEVLVVDNGGDAETRRLCQDFGSGQAPLPLRYIQEPRVGISHARNAVLDHIPAHCDYVALIDDDEIPCPRWLDELLALQRATGADLVRGPVIPRYAPGTPAWITRGNYFGWPRPEQRITDGQNLEQGATNNMLLRWSAVRATGARFDTGLARTGGEDTVYFHQLIHAHKLKMVFAARACVTETIPPTRTSLRALLRLHFRLGANRLLKKTLRASPGDNKVMLTIVHAGKGVRHVLLGTAGLFTCWLPGGGGRTRALDSLLRLARGAGHFAGLLGLRYRYYGGIPHSLASDVHAPPEEWDTRREKSASKRRRRSQ